MVNVCSWERKGMAALHPSHCLSQIQSLFEFVGISTSLVWIELQTNSAPTHLQTPFNQMKTTHLQRNTTKVYSSLRREQPLRSQTDCMFVSPSLYRYVYLNYISLQCDHFFILKSCKARIFTNFLYCFTSEPIR